MTCNLAVLNITDGHFSINLLDKDGIIVTSWLPSIPQFKGGGVIGSSPFVDGIVPAFGVYDAIEENFSVTAVGLSADDLARRLQDLRRMLRQASVFWFGRSGSATYPDITGVVWLEARLHNETNTRYAVLTAGGIDSDGQVIGQPMLQQDGHSIMQGLTMNATRLHWTANKPGYGTDVEALSAFYFSGTLYGTVDDNQDTEPETEGIYISNKLSVANVTNVHNGTAGSNLLDGPFPYTLFDGGTDVLFGCVGLNQPITNLVFDLIPGDGDADITWQYLSAAGPTWSSLSDVTGTGDLKDSGRTILTFTAPAFDTSTSPGGSLSAGIWIRAHIGSGSYTTEPQQQNRNIYSQTSGYLSINLDQVEGDVPALLKLRFDNPGSVPFTTRVVNRIIGGLKTVYAHPDFGAIAWNFTHIVNFSEQNPTGWTASGNITAVTDAGTGRAITGTTNANTAFNTSGDAILVLDDALSYQYTGDFRLFIRAKNTTLPTTDGYTSSLNARVKVSSYNLANADANIIYTRTEPVLFDDPHLIDFGIITLPPGGTRSEYRPRSPGRVRFMVQLRNDHASTNIAWTMYDLILIPVSEWSFDVSDDGSSLGSSLATANYLEIDGIESGIPRAVLKANLEGGLVPVGTELQPWTLVMNGHPRLNSGVAQRLCLITEYRLLGATPPSVYESLTNTVLKVSLEANQQYFSLRGEY